MYNLKAIARDKRFKTYKEFEDYPIRGVGKKRKWIIWQYAQHYGRDGTGEVQLEPYEASAYMGAITKEHPDYKRTRKPLKS